MQQMTEDPSRCWALLAKYLRSFADCSARWYPILLDVSGSLSSFLGLDYNMSYIPLLYKCGLLTAKEKKAGGENKVLYSLNLAGLQSQKSYSWNAFFTEYNLVNLEITNSYIGMYKQRVYLIRIGSFDTKQLGGKCFTPVEQYRDNICPQGIKGNSRNRIRFVKELAQELPLETMWLEAEKKRGTSEKVAKTAAVDPNTADADVEEESLDMENFKLLLKNNFFTPILKNESDFANVWDAIDTSKLVKATVDFVSSLQRYFCEKNKQELQAVDSGTSTGLEPFHLQEGKTVDQFPVLKRFCIPLEEIWIHGILRDIVKLSKSVEGDRKILSFCHYNDTNVTLLPVSMSSSYYRFKRNLKSHGWFNRLLDSVSN